MAGETRIIAFGSGDDNADRAEFSPADEVELEENVLELGEAEEEFPSAQSRRWLLPALAVAAVAAWTGFFAWARQAEIWTTPHPSAWTELIADWSMPVLLICALWLVFMRNSRREAERFGNVAQLLSAESARLETRLSTVNRELSLAREFIGSQSRDLEALGRIATERLSKNADRLQQLIQDNGARIDAIGSVSEAALGNMEKLRGQLPVIASSAKDITNNIGNAGRTAHAQIAEMADGFERLSEFGQTSEQQVQSLCAKVDETIAEFARQCDQLGEIASNRFTALAERGDEFRTQLEAHEVEALAAIRSRASALAEELEQTRLQLDDQEAESLTSLRARLSAMRDEGSAISRSIREGENRAIKDWRAGVERIREDMAAAFASLEESDRAVADATGTRLATLADEIAAIEDRISERGRAFDEEIQLRRAEAEASDEQAAARLSERLSALDAEIERRRNMQEQQSAAIAAHNEAVVARIAECEQRLTEIAGLCEQSQSSITAGVESLTERLSQARSMLQDTDRDLVVATDGSMRLFEMLDSAARLNREELRSALDASNESLASLENRIATILENIGETDRRGENLSGLVESSNTRLAEIGAEIEAHQSALRQRGDAYEAQLVGLRSVFEAIEQQSDRLAEKAQGELSEAIERLITSVQEATDTIADKGAAAVSALAVRLGEESSAAIDKAMHLTTAETTGRLEQAAAHAAGVGREAAVQLRDQLAKVNELVGNLERRVVHARQRAEEQVDNDFSRRVALITESLNSNSIDIARVLSTDVSHTAWAAYLRGDRGIFTRRAVNLLDSGETKAIIQIFESDTDFREHVSRYIHDFEAMLRQVLSTRDGHALGVTLLSSDMGKLYVALAQAIERLRN